ncbi:integrase core domain-containing protein [Streptomyces sp. NPDC054933]
MVGSMPPVHGLRTVSPSFSRSSADPQRSFFSPLKHVMLAMRVTLSVHNSRSQQRNSADPVHRTVAASQRASSGWLWGSGIGPVRAPRANAYIERWIGGCRQELLDRMLIVNGQHLRHVLAEYETHFNTPTPCSQASSAAQAATGPHRS